MDSIQHRLDGEGSEIRPAHVEQLARRRIPGSRFVIGALVVADLLLAPCWQGGSGGDLALQILGFALVAIAACGRVWASAFICGRKTAVLVTHGPYSLTRNPLYLCSMLAAIGVSIASRNAIMLAAVVVGLVPYYVMVCRAEASRLARRHGASYREYASMTPLLLPHSLAIREPATIEVYSERLRKACGDSFLILLAWIGAHAVAVLHGLGVLPALLPFLS